MIFSKKKKKEERKKEKGKKVKIGGYTLAEIFFPSPLRFALMRRRHFRRLPRYRPPTTAHCRVLFSCYVTKKERERKKFSLSTLFSPLSANRRPAVARNPFCPKLFTSPTPCSPREKHCEGRSKDNIHIFKVANLQFSLWRGTIFILFFLFSL